MKHPDSDEILEFYREELSEERTREIRDHVATCEECRAELRSLEDVGRWLAEWGDETVEEESIERVRNTLQILSAAAVEHTAVNGQARRVFGVWFRRIAGAAAVVAFMLLFQAFIWNPIKSSVNLLAVFNLSATAFAMPADHALPDTVLVVTVHHDGTFSTPMLKGRYELEVLTEELSALVPKGEYRSILLIGEDKDDPVSLALEDLAPLKEELDIKEVHVGEGVIGVASVLFERWLTPAPILPSLFLRSGEGWPAGEAWTVQSFPAGMLLSPWDADSLRAERLHNAVLRNFWIQSAFGPDQGDVLLKALTEPSTVTATVAESGDYILSRAVVGVEEVEDSLKKILDLNPDLSLTILVEDEENPGDAALRLESIARKVGFESITFKMMITPVYAQGTTGSVKGKVTDRETGDPLPAVNIFILDSDENPTSMGGYTSEDGEYTILNVPPGRYILRTAYVGYKTMQLQDLLVAVGVATTTNFQLEKVATGRIDGSVTDARTGVPLDRASVFVLGPDGTASSIGAFSNSRGEFTIINIPPGTYVIRAVIPGYVTFELKDVKVSAGITTRIKFEMEKGR